MYFTKIWLHLIWETPTPFPKAFKPIFYGYFRQYAYQNGIELDILGGTNDHVHCLVQLNALQHIHKTILKLKSELAEWINQCHIVEHFEWDEAYFAVSVGESQVEQIRNYIQNQENLHQKKTFEQEKAEIIERYGF